jgi:hypothetical protein
MLARNTWRGINSANCNIWFRVQRAPAWLAVTLGCGSLPDVGQHIRKSRAWPRRGRSRYRLLQETDLGWSAGSGKVRCGVKRNRIERPQAGAPGMPGFHRISPISPLPEAMMTPVSRQDRMTIARCAPDLNAIAAGLPPWAALQHQCPQYAAARARHSVRTAASQIRFRRPFKKIASSLLAVRGLVGP